MMSKVIVLDSTYETCRKAVRQAFLHVFQVTRLKEVAGAYYRNFSKNLRLVELEKPFRRTVAVLNDVLESDVYISVPKMKTHGLTMLSGAVKNNFGLLAGAQKSWYHYYCVKPEIFAEIILASNDGVALDTVLAGMVGFNLDDVPYLRLARDLRLGETDLTAIEIEGEASTIHDYHRPAPPEATYSYRAGVGSGKTSIEFYRQRVSYRPVISAERCHHLRGCTACVDICPAKALNPGDPTPAKDYSKCILCSACKEVCEYGSLEYLPDEQWMTRLAK
ncbi:MAG: hypothetical protein H6Q48_4991 [Deltaproteobacteria bacterium]|nr:hypothetical protein [Deltaproteobacteria bacterium]